MRLGTWLELSCGKFNRGLVLGNDELISCRLVGCRLTWASFKGNGGTMSHVEFDMCCEMGVCC